MGKKTSQKKGNQVEETKTSTAKVERKDNGTTEEHDQKPHLSLLKNPVTTLYYFMLVLIDFGVKILKFAMRNIIWIALIAAFFVVPRVIDHPYHHVTNIKKILFIYVPYSSSLNSMRWCTSLPIGLSWVSLHPSV